MMSRDWFRSPIADFRSTSNTALDPDLPNLNACLI